MVRCEFSELLHDRTSEDSKPDKDRKGYQIYQDEQQLLSVSY